jgi:hypothetical protein
VTTHVPMTSGGIGSWLTGVRVVQTAKPGDTVHLLFADVKGDNPSPHAGEDEDTYRFLAESTAHTIATAPEGVSVDFVHLSEGRDIWQVFTDDRFLGNSRLANCSKFLKQRPAREWLEANCDPADTVVYVGIDWTETHRLPAIVNAYKPYRAEAPLMEFPFLSRDDMRAMCEEAGIAVPRLYRAGFPHNNCGGFCVRAGQAQMELLLREHPERFAYHEAKEEELREHLGKDVAILRDRTGGTSTPLTLRRFRERVQIQPELIDGLDWGGCGCFVDEPTATEASA